jgi:hypothetical protein
MRTSNGWTAAAATAASTVATHDVQYFSLRNKGNAKVSSSLLFTPQLRVPNTQLRDPQQCKNATRTIANPEKIEAHAQRVTAARATCHQEPLQHHQKCNAKNTYILLYEGADFFATKVRGKGCLSRENTSVEGATPRENAAIHGACIGYYECALCKCTLAHNPKRKSRRWRELLLQQLRRMNEPKLLLFLYSLIDTAFFCLCEKIRLVKGHCDRCHEL